MDFERRKRCRLRDRLRERDRFDCPIRAQQDDDPRDQHLQCAELRVVGARREVCVAAEQVVEVVDARLHVPLPIADALGRQPRQKGEQACRVGRDGAALRIEADQHLRSRREPPEIRHRRRVHARAVLVGVAQQVERHASESVSRQVEAREHRLEHVCRVLHAGDAAQRGDELRDLRLQRRQLRRGRAAQPIDVDEVGSVEQHLPVGAKLHAGATDRLVLEGPARDHRVEAHARHERHDQQERDRPMRLHR